MALLKFNLSSKSEEDNKGGAVLYIILITVQIISALITLWWIIRIFRKVWNVLELITTVIDKVQPKATLELKLDASSIPQAVAERIKKI